MKPPISRAAVARLHGGLSHIPNHANQVVNHISAILSWGEKIGELPAGSNLCASIDKYPDKKRERLISADELARLGDVLDSPKWNAPAVAVIRLLAFTGARLGEVCGLEWGWIDRDRGVARLPDSKTGRKNLFLPPAALAVLDTIPRKPGNPHVFPCPPWRRPTRIGGPARERGHHRRHDGVALAKHPSGGEA